MPERIGLGVLGAGMIATADYGILPNLRSLETSVRVAAISGRDPERARSVAAAFGIPAVHDDLDSLLADPAVEAVVNLTPAREHGWTNRRILAAGKHLISEKPLATTYDDAVLIAESARRDGLLVVCAPPAMLLPSRRRARELVQQGALGRIAFARVRSSHAGPAALSWPTDPTPFYAEQEGPLFDLGVYGLSEITGILGPVRRVTAFAGRTARERRAHGGLFDGRAIRVESDDNVLALLDFGGSVFASIDITYNVQAGAGPTLEIHGESGTLAVSERVPFTGLDARVTLTEPWSAGGAIRDESGSGEGLYSDERVEELQRAILVDHFVRCLRAGTAPVLTAEHAVHVIDVLEAIAGSARTGLAVEVHSDLDSTASRPQESRDD